MNYVKTYEEYMGDRQTQFVVKKKRKEKQVASISTNTAGKKYDQEADGSDQITRSTLNF
jgi:hypothetical protein